MGWLSKVELVDNLLQITLSSNKMQETVFFKEKKPEKEKKKRKKKDNVERGKRKKYEQ